MNNRQTFAPRVKVLKRKSYIVTLNVAGETFAYTTKATTKGDAFAAALDQHRATNNVLTNVTILSTSIVEQHEMIGATA